jgi:simple sugar transport system permease protein
MAGSAPGAGVGVRERRARFEFARFRDLALLPALALLLAIGSSCSRSR